MVGSLDPTSFSVSITRTGPWSAKTTLPSRISYCSRPSALHAEWSWRNASSGCSAISTSAISLLVRRVEPRERDCPPSCGPGCARRRSRRGSALAATGRRRAARRPVVVLRERDHLGAVVDRDLELGDPVGQQALDVVLPEPEAVVVAGREVADVQPHGREARDLRDLALLEEPIGDAALIEHLDRSRVQAAGP
jgi:hypothetical protein